MGILDDAIREHLELKRRHGVTEDELQRQEEEALGPARRDVAQQHEEADPAAAGQDTALFDGEEPAPATAAPVAADEPVALEESPADLDEPPSLAEEPDAELEEELEAELEEELAEDPEKPEDALVDSDLEDEDGDNDVLEDTPDFLQETPEHDRLWFEQKPPRDFDFD